MADIPFDMGNVWECACLTFTNADKCEKCGMENNALFLQTFDYSISTEMLDTLTEMENNTELRPSCPWVIKCHHNITRNQMIYCKLCKREHGNIISLFHTYSKKHTCIYKFFNECVIENLKRATILLRDNDYSQTPNRFIKEMNCFQNDIVNTVIGQSPYIDFHHQAWKLYRYYINIFIFIACSLELPFLLKYIKKSYTPPILFDLPAFRFSSFSSEIQEICLELDICDPSSMDKHELRQYLYLHNNYVPVGYSGITDIDVPIHIDKPRTRPAARY